MRRLESAGATNFLEVLLDGNLNYFMRGSQ